ncbi:MAG: FAD-dependent oxidoreductase [Acidimicrobiales bacterium]|nr:FAD-dependent oxidoreductase [Acidimicrobiales bacterium]
MPRDPRFDVLFEPVRIGPVTAPNRFYQVPHCTGIGYRRPQTLAALRGMKAEGGWGTVCTEYCSIHPSSDDDPYPSASIWDDEDVRSLSLMVDKVHNHGALAGVELWHGGGASANHYSREAPLGPFSRPAGVYDPIQTRAMDKDDIRELKRWHVEAAVRAQRAGFDIVYVYACHWYLLKEFLNPSNQRSDEYGGSLENRVRLLRELIEETKEAVGDTCAVAVRFAASSGGPDDDQDTAEPRAVVELLADLPDLWDITVHDYSHEMGSSRFVQEGSLEATVSWVKEVTNKPVVSVGRFTSPETMLRLVRQGVIDLVGAARPSIADPFLPQKIAEGREDDIRECIGCNICYVGDQTGTPIRCTQNPTMGEEWRKGWHPEQIPPKGSESRVLIVGGGPAGLEAAVSLGRRGYEVVLAEARTELGGRVTLESALPGMAEYARVRDWRLTQIGKLPNVEFYLDSVVDEEQILEFGADRVVIATGAQWRRDGTGRWREEPVPGWDGASVITPDDIMADKMPSGPVVVFDDDHYYMGGVVAEKLRRAGLDVTLVTPANEVSTWTTHTDEQYRIQERILGLGIVVETGTSIAGIGESSATLECIYTGKEREVDAAAVVMTTARVPNDSLYHSLAGRIAVQRIGDCLAPGTIAASVYSGHQYARELDADKPADVRFRRERAVVPRRHLRAT